MPLPHHPILKHPSSQQPIPNYDPFPHLLDPQVHFPPSPSLTRTFKAHSAAQYDRTPIQVAPNACALPARGCPGRTYYDQSSRAKKALAQAPVTRRGASLHPRALNAAPDDEDEDEEDDDDDSEERTPTRTSPYIPLPVPPPIPHSAYPYAPPPLVPDLSSESDESDGFASPPPELASAPSSHSSSSAYPQHRPSPSSHSPQYSPQFSSHSPQSHSSQSSLRPRRPQTPFARSSSPDEEGYEEEDLPASYSHSPHSSRSSTRDRHTRERSRSRSRERDRDRKDHKDGKKDKDNKRVSSLCRVLKAASFRDAEGDGCLGGF
ncbi:hypothetical protein R3P38DRAFT_3322166 [Favolaschia claudopus]|uniref:Uncharacterized protein n=1 Tax=Favolaschia claudopus TaxID=2862362 RepID=A0AAW0AMZ8_9AGAR